MPRSPLPLRRPAPFRFASPVALALGLALAGLALGASGCGDDPMMPPDGDQVGDPIDGRGDLTATWPGGQTVMASAWHMAARVPCATTLPDDPNEICDAVITGSEGGELKVAISIPSVKNVAGQTVSLNDPSLVRIEVHRADTGEVATAGQATKGALAVDVAQIRPTLSFAAQFSPDATLTVRIPGGLIEVAVTGSLTLP
jgi:hypothetical protein